VRAARAGDDSVLGVVSDITDRVLLARELEQVRADSGSQAALLLQLLRVDPDQLHLFTSSADVALRKSNAMLTAPGIEQQDLKNKLNGVFRELHSVKGEASALGLASFAQRIHKIEDMLQSLRGKNALSGNDFVPVVVRLDELINHLTQIQSMQERVVALRGSRSAQAPRPDSSDYGEEDSHRITTVLAGATGPESEGGDEANSASVPSQQYGALADALRSLAHDTAAAMTRSVQLRTSGLEHVPPHYASLVKNVCIQMIRNAIAHGIEPPEERRRQGKPEEGTVRITFTDPGFDGAADFRLTIEDDGHGLKYETIVDKALRLGLISPQQAVSLERAAIYRLIFLPGFSTTEEISEHAGRGVGLDAVSTLVREYGGKIGVSTLSGRYTRFRVMLPQVPSVSASSAA
jgi:two-component system, chemotaxis family, sensor kinase CheA